MATHTGVDGTVKIGTDAIAEVSSRAGAIIPFCRPKHLSSDTASSVSVIMHAIEYYNAKSVQFDFVMVLQPTSPFRKASTIRQALDVMCDKDSSSLVSVSKASLHPEHCFDILGETPRPLMGWEVFDKRTQDLSNAWYVNGLIYMVKPDSLVSRGKIISEDFFPFRILDVNEAFDIDTPEDFEFAEHIARNLND